MTEFSQKRFVDLGQTLYIEWLKTLHNMQNTKEQERRLIFRGGAKVAFEAAEEFSIVFCYQEDN